MASSTKVPLSFEEFWARRTEEYAYFNETSLRNYLQVLVRIEPEPMERSSTVRTVSGMLRLYGGTCRMHIGHDGSLEYALKTWRDRDEDGNFRPLMRWFEEITATSSTEHASGVKRGFLFLGHVLSRPRGGNGDWTDTKSYLCSELLDGNAPGMFWRLEDAAPEDAIGALENTVKASFIAEDVVGLDGDTNINSAPKSELLLKASQRTCP
ncbi:hypothetical protein BU26DRAFT_513741 [Trematosphaeria pertusa]|uniref:Uncharacterized protein n=1 Tax=Trematosphaeria pertusa TaxID=390896 RepID=A0A6A6J2F3_9PLEO|nr:uncharacterized protein BU26DRAFT_513741 [Trematosphaeria pertusa]KAF2257014.1 hypothetical protein BU26DRAFT_513741 [Trematosphaeria pertusa]